MTDLTPSKENYKTVLINADCEGMLATNSEHFLPMVTGFATARNFNNPVYGQKPRKKGGELPMPKKIIPTRRSPNRKSTQPGQVPRKKSEMTKKTIVSAVAARKKGADSSSTSASGMPVVKSVEIDTRTAPRRYPPVVAEFPDQDVDKVQSGSSAGNVSATVLSQNGLAALDYARHGFRVFPLPPGTKRPRAGSRAEKDATCDESKIITWWTQNPQYGVAIATGDGLTVLDIDGERGKESLAKLVKILGELPTTVTVLTPGKGGGLHLYFRTNRSLPNHVWVADCVDVRGEKGYVVAPPSQHPNGGCYGFNVAESFRDIEIATLPEQWEDFMDLGGRSTTARFYSRKPRGDNSSAGNKLPTESPNVSISIGSIGSVFIGK
jgi:hypothetical protein